MDMKKSRYGEYALVREMLETPEVIRRMDWKAIDVLAEKLEGLSGRLLLTGEGSSRIFPAKRAIADVLRRSGGKVPFTEGATQAMEYELAGGAACIASNSGKTKEGVRLLRALKARGVKTIGIVANGGTPIVDEADAGLVLACGEEKAVAATKSVMEQALVYHRLASRLYGLNPPNALKIADALEVVLAAEPPAELTDAVSGAKSLFWAGRNDGVAEELTLKTNEIARKRSDFLEGTYAVHGIEEVMDKSDCVILVNPFEDEEEKFRSVLLEGVGLKVVAISHRKTSFPTFIIPELEEGAEYLQLAAGWSLLVEAGIALGIDLDHPARARKVGNEMEQ